jgi:molecular chaperone HscB
MQLEQNFFKLFDLAEEYHVDVHQLSDRYRVLQKEVHPDRFAHASDREQLLAVQYTAHINEALNTLKTPLKRAQYMLKLKGKELCPESSAPMDPMFLMQQMEWREALEHLSRSDDPESELEDLEAEVECSWRQMETDFIGAISSNSELDKAVSCVRKMQFLDKLRHEIELAEDEFLDD